ncbi:MAG TPA: HAD-IIB family hydrolase [Polyangiaceae bacterium]|nr:HAD-IIB family hydrolase [Polyangiaceae bacterium]
MMPLSAISRARAERLRGVAFDLDDTLLDHGRLLESTYSALFRLHDAGFLLYGVTGRPAGWADVLARLFPVQAMIAENGAITCARRGSKVELIDSVDSATRRQRGERLDQLAIDLMRRFPDFVLSDDVRARISDRTFDVGEHHQVPAERVEQAAAFLRDAGARVFTSSVHLHATFDYADKASGAVRVLTQDTGLDATAVRHAFAYLGDSENDASCFAAFDLSIGVSNLRGRGTLHPRYVTSRPMGAGVAEAAAAILSVLGKL